MDLKVRVFGLLRTRSTELLWQIVVSSKSLAVFIQNPTWGTSGFAQNNCRKNTLFGFGIDVHTQNGIPPGTGRLPGGSARSPCAPETHISNEIFMKFQSSILSALCGTFRTLSIFLLKKVNFNANILNLNLCNYFVVLRQHFD